MSIAVDERGTTVGLSTASDGQFARPVIRTLLRPEVPALVFLVVLMAVFAATAHGFFSPANLQQILVEVAIVGVIALGVNQVILAGEIDVSVGSGLAICAWAAGSVAVHQGGLVLPLLTALGIGIGIDVINGFLVVKARIPSIIVTLAMLYGLRGVENVYTRSASLGSRTAAARSAADRCSVSMLRWLFSSRPSQWWRR